MVSDAQLSHLLAVAILSVIRRPSTEPHTLLVTQFRPPVGQCVVELPAGLIDKGDLEGDVDEGVKRAALRELSEETGYGTSTRGAKVHAHTPSSVIMNDPGMSGANMKLCIVDISLSDDAEEPIAHPDPGEYVDKHLVPLRTLPEQLRGRSLLACH